MKILELAISADLSAKALAEAMTRVEGEPHDGWADLIVHQAQLRRALKLVNEHNLTKPSIRIRALCETRMGHDDWKLRTRSTEVRIIWEKKDE